MFSVESFNQKLASVSPWVSAYIPKSSIDKINDIDFFGLILAFQSIRQLYAIEANSEDVIFDLGDEGEFTFLVDFATYENNNATFPTIKCRKPIIYFKSVPNFIFDNNLIPQSGKKFENVYDVFSVIQSQVDLSKNSKEVYIYLASKWNNDKKLLFSEDIAETIAKIQTQENIKDFFVYDNLPSWNDIVKRLVDVLNKPFRTDVLPKSSSKLNSTKFKNFIISNEFTLASLESFFLENIKSSENSVQQIYLDSILKNKIQKFPIDFYYWKNNIFNSIKFAQLAYNAFALWLATSKKEQISLIAGTFWKAKSIINHILTVLSYNNCFYIIQKQSYSTLLDFNFEVFKNYKNLPNSSLFQYLSPPLNSLSFQSRPYTWGLNQIDYLVNHFRSQDLISMINKIVYIKAGDKNHIASLVSSSKNDLDLYSKLHAESKPKEEYNRGINRVEELKNFSIFSDLQSSAKKKSFKYLDFGGQNGEIAFEVAKELGINNEKQCFVYDIESWFDTEMKGNKNITYNFSRTNILPYENNSFDFITVFMVVHHIKYPKLILNELYRILKPNGTIIFREHDSDGDATDVLIDVEHSLFEVVEKKEPNYFALESYYAKYYSKEEFIRLVESSGNNSETFTYNKGEIVKNSTRDPKIPVGPTRYYYSIFTKNNNKFDWINDLNSRFKLTQQQSLFLEIKRRELWNNILKVIESKIKMKEKDLKLLLLRYFFNKNNNYNKFFGEVEQNKVIRKSRDIEADPLFLTNQSIEALKQLVSDFNFQKLGSKETAISLSYLIDSEFYKAAKAIKEAAIKPKSAEYKIQNFSVSYDGIEVPDPIGILKSLEYDINIDIYALLWLRYNYIALGTQGLSMIYEDFNIKDKNKVVEAFAGAFNHYFKNWGSAFPEEIELGSFGNFFEVIEFVDKVSVFFVNPPFDESVMEKTFKKVLDIAKTTKSKFIITIPDWENLPYLEEFKAAIKPFKGEVKKFKKEEYQYINRLTNEKINAVDTLEITFETF